MNVQNIAHQAVLQAYRSAVSIVLSSITALPISATTDCRQISTKLDAATMQRI
jgi:hypothetical protein